MKAWFWSSLLILTGLCGACAPAQPTAQPTVTATIEANRASTGDTLIWTFEDDPVGGLPKGTTAFSGTWMVRADADALSPPNDLCQSGSADYPALQLGDVQFTNLIASMRFKPLSGRTDQAAGFIYRIQDKDNYYIVRAHALEGNIVWFKYVGGQRSPIAEGKAQVASGQWQSLRIEARGNRLRAFFESQPIIDATDDTFKSGKFGLWTQSDSVSCFDNVQATAR